MLESAGLMGHADDRYIGRHPVVDTRRSTARHVGNVEDPFVGQLMRALSARRHHAEREPNYAKHSRIPACLGIIYIYLVNESLKQV